MGVAMSRWRCEWCGSGGLGWPACMGGEVKMTWPLS